MKKKILIKINRVSFILIFSVTSLLINKFFNLIDTLLPISYQSSPNQIIHNSWGFKIIVGVLIAPLLETLLFWSVPYWLYKTILKESHKVFFILFSATLFAISHFYGIMYMISMFSIAILLWSAYFSSTNRHESSILNVTLIHLLHNCIVLLIK